MEARQVKASSQKNTVKISDALDELCSYYLSIGVTYNEFWYGDFCRLKYYREAYEMQRERDNQRIWLEGLYNYRAFKAVMEMFAYGLAGGKGKKPEGYLDKPFPITEREREAERQRRIEYTRRWVEKGQLSKG